MTIDIDKERPGFEAWFMQNRSMRERPARATDSASLEDGRDYQGNAVECCWQGWQARAAIPPATAQPVGYFELPTRSGSTYREVDPKYKGDPDVVPLYRHAAPGDAIVPPLEQQP